MKKFEKIYLFKMIVNLLLISFIGVTNLELNDFWYGTKLETTLDDIGDVLYLSFVYQGLLGFGYFAYLSIFNTKRFDTKIEKNEGRK